MISNTDNEQGDGNSDTDNEQGDGSNEHNLTTNPINSLTVDSVNTEPDSFSETLNSVGLDDRALAEGLYLTATMASKSVSV